MADKHVTKQNLGYFYEHGVRPVKVTAERALETAEQRALALTYDDYSAMLADVVAFTAEDLKEGDLLIVNRSTQPNAWVAAVNKTSAVYTYTDDADVITQLNSADGLTVGYFVLRAKAQNSGSNVGEENYIKGITIRDEDYANGVASVTVDADGNLIVNRKQFLTPNDVVTPDEHNDAQGGAMSKADKWKLDQLKIYEPLTEEEIDAIIAGTAQTN